MITKTYYFTLTYSLTRVSCVCVFGAAALLRGAPGAAAARAHGGARALRLGRLLGQARVRRPGRVPVGGDRPLPVPRPQVRGEVLNPLATLKPSHRPPLVGRCRPL
eukprot:7296780-Pyramimonas_sp.AAC.2